jgi:nicotinamidase-related amidase
MPYTRPLLGLFIGVLSIALLSIVGSHDLVADEGEARSANKAKDLVVQTRRRVNTGAGRSNVVTDSAAWAPTRTAIIVCDMWDTHTCKGAAGRVAEMAPAVNRTLRAARKKGVFIIHAPSGTMGKYKDTPERQRAVQAPLSKAPVEIKWNYWDTEREGEEFTTIAHGGCACPKPCPNFVEDEAGIRKWQRGPELPWSRQIETIRIESEDAVSDNGQEVFNLLEARNIQNVILMGVHTNICVSGRPFGLRQMSYHGKNVVLCRDLTDSLIQATVPGIDQFRGTEIVVEHIEKHICPTITSRSITGAPEFRFEGSGSGAIVGGSNR